MISPDLWDLVVNKILLKLNNKGTKVFAYADEVVVFIKGNFVDKK